MESQHKTRRHRRREEPEISQDTSGRSDEQRKRQEIRDGEVDERLEAIDYVLATYALEQTVRV